MPHPLTRQRSWQRTLLLLMIAALAAMLIAQRPTSAAPAGWHTSGAQILAPNNSRFVITGVNWYGFETRDNVAHGMWSKHFRYILDEVKRHGFNTVRLPFSNSVWGNNPIPSNSKLSGCPECQGKRARDIMAMIVNYAGSIGLHVVMVNHRSTAGNSAEANGLWYTSGFPESIWIRDWLSVQEWVHGIPQTLGGPDTIPVNYLASDGYPIVLGYDLRNEPHLPSRTNYLDGATWGSGDGIDPAINPNPNPFSPACVATSTCHDWRLAAERAGTTLLGAADQRGWAYPLLFVEGVSTTPAAGGSPAAGPYDWVWNGGNLLGVNGNSSNPGAPIVFNSGGNASTLGPPVTNQLVYSAHDYGPSLYRQPWFNASTCYRSGCAGSSLSDFWAKHWGYVALPNGINPTWPGHSAYPWSNTGHSPYSQAPIFLGEFGTANAETDLTSTVAGSQGQWFTAIINFIQSSYSRSAANDSGLPLSDLHYTYWAWNDEDLYAVAGSSYTGLENPRKVFSFLCFVQQGPLALPQGSGAGQCGSTGQLPAANAGAPTATPTPGGATPTPTPRKGGPR